MFKRHYIALALVIVLVLILLNLPSQTMDKFKLAVGSLFVPVFGFLGSAQKNAEKAGNASLSRQDLARQNDLLRRENEQLRLRAGEADEIWRENARLRQLIGWQSQQRTRYKLARVVARDPSNWWRTIQIDLGSRDGMKPNLPVRTMEGLVGRINVVGYTRSQVLLLGDPNLRVGAVIQDTRESGIVFSGSSNPLENNMVDLGFLSHNSAIKPGQFVLTSGEGGVFPRGIPIGQIVDSQPAEFGLTVEARIKLFANMNAIEEVWVITP